MGNVFTFARDSLTNLTSRMGTDRDKASRSFYAGTCLTDEQIFNAYRDAWLPRKIVDIPAFDSCREWRNWQADDAAIEKIEAEEKRLNVKGKVLEARISARLWGGAAVYIGTKDQNPAEPLDTSKHGAGSITYLTVLSRRKLAAGEIIRDPASEWYGRPQYYTLQGQGGATLNIHPSRLAIFYGNRCPDDDFSGNQGWGDSVLQSVLNAVKQADGTAANIASLVFEAKVDVIRVPGFMEGMADEGYKRKILERYTLANTGKGINGTLMLDKEEEYDSKSTSFANLTEILMAFMQVAAGAADIPATRLLGQSPSGMNATGESDTRNYYDRIAANQVIEMEPALRYLDEMLIRSATGSRDPGIYYEWAPLWGLSDTERATIFKTKADAARALAGGSGQLPLMPIEALSDALVNAFIEDGSLPGLEAAIEEYGGLSEQIDNPDDALASLSAPATAAIPEE